MTKRTPTIDINTLPVRSRPLTDDAMADVFGGGCNAKGEGCNEHKDCCGDMECDAFYPPGTCE